MSKRQSSVLEFVTNATKRGKADHDHPEIIYDRIKKIVSWNITSIASATRKGYLDVLKKIDADIILLQETKLNQGLPVPEFEGYPYVHALSAEKKGYSGVLMASRIKPLSVQLGLNDKQFDGEGRIITAEFNDFYLINTYTPNAGDKLKRLDFKLGFNAKFLSLVESLQLKKPVIWAGDVNVAHHPIDLARPDGNKKNAGFSIEERDNLTQIMEQCCLVDSWRKLHPDVVGYTYWGFRFQAKAKNTGWRLDYFLVDQLLMDKVVSCEILEDEHGPSDHVPIVLSL